MRIAFFGDLHLDPATELNTRPALRELVKRIPATEPDVVVDLGDLSWKRGHLAPWVSLELREAHVALAGCAPTIVIAGNHDLVSGGEVGTVLGALDESGDVSPLLYEHPAILPDVGGTWFACLPYPSRHWLLANRPELKASEINAAMSAALLDVVRGLAAQVPAGASAVLLFHGSIAGARSDSEQLMSTEIDTVLSEPEIPACFTHVLCGHIHRRQQIGRAIYPGSPAPLTFAEEQHPHGFGVLDTVTGEVEWHELPVAHRLLTVNDVDASIPDEVLTGGQDVTGSRVRVRARLQAGELPAEVRTYWTRRFEALGAEDVRVSIERAEVEPRGASAPPIERAELIDLYLARRPDAADLNAELKILADQIDEQIPAEIRMKELAGSYRLIRLAWSNWKSYGPDNELVVDELAGTVSIEGDNATGKSNAAEVECFVLYGRTPRGRVPLGELVRQGERDALVAAEFEAQGQRWKIERRLKLNSKGVGSADLTLYQWEAPELRAVGAQVAEADWMPASAGTASETQAAITQLVGPIELYLSTRFASQGDIDRLVDLTGAEMKDTLQAVLATSVFEERESRARLVVVAQERAAEKHGASLTAYQEEAGKLPEREAAATDSAASLATSEADAEASSTLLDQAREHAAEAKRASDQVDQAIGQWDRSAGALTAAGKRLSDAEAATHRDVAAIEASGHLIPEAVAAELEASRASVASLKERRAREDGSRAAVSEAEHGLASARSAIDSHLQLRKARIEALEDTASRLLHERERQSVGAGEILQELAEQRQHRADAMERSLHARREQAASIGLAPFGERCAPCPLMKVAVDARSSIPSDEQGLRDFHSETERLVTLKRAELEAEAEALKAQHAAAIDEHSAYSATPDHRLAELQAVARSAEGRLEVARQKLAEPFDELALMRAEKALSVAESNARQLEALRDARARVAAAAPAIAATRSEVERLSEAHAALGERPVAFSLHAAMHAAVAEVDRCVRALEDARGVLAARRQFDADRQAELRLCQSAIEKLAAAATETARLERELRVARIYLEAVGRDGIPYMMLERALPALEAHANHFLCADQGSGLSIEVDGLRELQSGERRLDVVIRYSNAFGTHSLSAASGFERTAIGYALRAALAQVQAETQGVRIEHWIADEGWGVFDESNLVSVGQPMVRRLAETFGRVILISHQAPIREVCESRFEVIGDPTSGSALRRVA